MEHLEHLVGMLDRDQRTAKLRFFNSSDRQVPNTCSFTEKTVNESTPSISSIINPRCGCPSRRKSSKSSYLIWKNRYLLNTFQSLKKVLIVVVYISLVIIIPSANSAPIYKMDTNNPRSAQPKWINPCNLTNETAPNSDTSSDISSDAELLSKIGNQAGIALTHAKSFREAFASKTLTMTYDEVHHLLKQHNLDWLNVSNKFLSEDVATGDLNKSEVDNILLEVYSFLQRVAVGMEQLVWDQEDNQGLFEVEFKKAEAELRNVLCEIQMAIIDRELTMRPDVTRDVMKDDDRRMNLTESKTRDFVIFREYMNVLEYISKVFTHMSK